MDETETTLREAAKGLRRSIKAFRRETGLPASKIIGGGVPIVHIDDALLSDCVCTSRREGLLNLVPKGGRACEVGTSTGRFAREIAARVQPQELHLIDVTFERFDDEAYSKVTNVPLIKHEGQSFDELAGFEQFFDLIYIDADHSYEIVKKDIDAALRAVKPTGHLMFNDYCRWSLEQGEPYGVQAAVNEFANKHRWAFRGIALSGSGHYDVLLTKM